MTLIPALFPQPSAPQGVGSVPWLFSGVRLGASSDNVEPSIDPLDIPRGGVCFALDCAAPIRHFALMAKRGEAPRLSWAWWGPWALIAVAATAVMTVAATLYDIL